MTAEFLPDERAQSPADRLEEVIARRIGSGIAGPPLTSEEFRAVVEYVMGEEKALGEGE